MGVTYVNRGMALFQECFAVSGKSFVHGRVLGAGGLREGFFYPGGMLQEDHDAEQVIGVQTMRFEC
jgi:hypothetical protein